MRAAIILGMGVPRVSLVCAHFLYLLRDLLDVFLAAFVEGVREIPGLVGFDSIRGDIAIRAGS